MHTQNGSGSAPREAQIRIEVYKVPEGSPVHVRMLSGQVDGLFAHWGPTRGQYCQPNVCCTSVQKPKRFWRGFVAAEVWCAVRKKWMPICFPITERLELDFRHRYKRGQTWQILQGKTEGKKHQPVRGKLVEENPSDSVPQAFPILPVLKTVYHCATLELGCKNPMPDIVLVTASDGPAPRGTVEESKPASPDDWEKFRQQYRQSIGQMPSDTASKNGQAQQ